MTVFLIVLFGLAWGSFLNVVIFRIPRDMSLVRPPSTCPNCGKGIKPYDNIPVLSYLILRGKCRHCGFGIPFSYFLVEVLTPAVFLALYFHHGRTAGIPFVASCLFASAMIALGFIDYYHQILPDEITLPGLVLALGYGLVRQDMGFRQVLIGAVVGVWIPALRLRGLLPGPPQGGVGDGRRDHDAGHRGLPGLAPDRAHARPGVIRRGPGRGLLHPRPEEGPQFALPFGTFLAPAAIVALLWGEPLLEAYLIEPK